MSSRNLKAVKSHRVLDTLGRVNLESTTAPSPVANPEAAPAYRLRPAETVVMVAASLGILVPSHAKWWPISATEGWGFVTGGICVWLVVRQHMWTWPIGLLNNIAFFVLFLRSRLFADMALQVVYFAMGIYGWWNWRFGGAQRTVLKVSRTTRAEWIVLTLAIPLSTIALRHALIAVNGAAPFWDALTTILSLAAQYLLCRKRLENWLFWIVADLIYVPLYLSRQLPLTAILYAVFLAMCLFGLKEWRRTAQRSGVEP